MLATTLEIKEKEKGALLELAMNIPELNKEGELKKEKNKKKKVRKKQRYKLNPYFPIVNATYQPLGYKVRCMLRFFNIYNQM